MSRYSSPKADRSTDRSATWRLKVLRAGRLRTFRIVAQVDESSPPGKQRNVATVKARNGKRKQNGASITVPAGGGPCPSVVRLLSPAGGATALSPGLSARRC